MRFQEWLQLRENQSGAIQVIGGCAGSVWLLEVQDHIVGLNENSELVFVNWSENDMALCYMPSAGRPFRLGVPRDQMYNVWSDTNQVVQHGRAGKQWFVQNVAPALKLKPEQTQQLLQYYNNMPPQIFADLFEEVTGNSQFANILRDVQQRPLPDYFLPAYRNDAVTSPGEWAYDRMQRILYGGAIVNTRPRYSSIRIISLSRKHLR